MMVILWFVFSRVVLLRLDITIGVGMGVPGSELIDLFTILGSPKWNLSIYRKNTTGKVTVSL